MGSRSFLEVSTGPIIWGWGYKPVSHLLAETIWQMMDLHCDMIVYIRDICFGRVSEMTSGLQGSLNGWMGVSSHVGAPLTMPERSYARSSYV